MSMTNDELLKTIEEAAEAAARKAAMNREDLTAIVAGAVRQTLVELGIDSANPIEMQRDFQHLRQWRRAGEDIRNKGLGALTAVAVTGFVGLIVVGLKDWFSK